ncbi:competence/damage-inducible protein-like protein cinA [Calycina marina]|uniref:Competence/damage-inducible protein-like protein cinA n=1 Tax=Calycina marina TaxID=1763456 RepID=A0A9P8CJ42_9HELO|nr:competence/damage-inducible protein-like protein cinA [Calycina marina]
MSDFPPQKIKSILQEVTALLKERKETVSIAETCAGGLISAALLSIPGASGFYKGGLMLYTLESRVAFAGWTEANTAAYEGPTPDVVTFLATNVRGKLGSTYTICESGTAGPTGGNTPTRTPGYVALVISSEKGTFTREVMTGSSDRGENMVAFATEALTLLRDVIKGDAKL